MKLIFADARNLSKIEIRETLNLVPGCIQTLI